MKPVAGALRPKSVVTVQMPTPRALSAPPLGTAIAVPVAVPPAHPPMVVDVQVPIEIGYVRLPIAVTDGN
jgi:hypothetical protein